MVRQIQWSQMGPDARVHALDKVRRFTRLIDARVPGRERPGVLRVVDAHGKERTLFIHQVVAVQRLLLKGRAEHWADRKGSLVAVHDLGTGKTITAVAAVAAIRSTLPRLDLEQSVVVCPLSVLHVWADAFDSWTTYDRSVLVATKQADLTTEALLVAKVVITTPDVLVAAFKSFMSIDPRSHSRKRMDRYVHGGDRPAGAPLPPAHPLFLRANVPNAFSCVIVDELHTVCNPNTLSGHAVGLLCRSAAYTLGLTGTPVCSKPQQVAWIAKTLNAQPQLLQDPRNYVVSAKRPVRWAGAKAPKADRASGSQTINKATLSTFHQELVDRVDASFLDLPPKVYTKIEFDPFIGRLADGTVDKQVIDAHNKLLEDAKRAMETAEAGARDLATFGQVERQTWGCIVAMSNYEFSSTLGWYGAFAFDNPDLYDEAVANPSEYMKLVARVLASRQAAGHARVAIFSESTTQLRILQRFLAREGACGDLFLYTGELSGKRRVQLVHDFLSCARGVMLLSGAGAIGTTLCPGCEVLLCVGSVPWNSTTLEQAHGRIWRIGQTRPVEIVQFVPRRSVTVEKLTLHIDKRERLARAVTDQDYSHFEETDEQRWRWQMKILKGLRPLNSQGNYSCTAAERVENTAWLRACERADANGLARPPAPKGFSSAPKLAHLVPIPRAPFVVSDEVDEPAAKRARVS